MLPCASGRRPGVALDAQYATESFLCLGSCLGRSGKFKIPVYTTYRGQTCLELGCTLKGVLLNLVAFNLGSVRRFVLSLGV